jgi:hypothetical protein
MSHTSSADVLIKDLMVKLKAQVFGWAHAGRRSQANTRVHDARDGTAICVIHQVLRQAVTQDVASIEGSGYASNRIVQSQLTSVQKCKRIGAVEKCITSCEVDPILVAVR